MFLKKNNKMINKLNKMLENKMKDKILLILKMNNFHIQKCNYM